MKNSRLNLLIAIAAAAVVAAGIYFGKHSKNTLPVRYLPHFGPYEISGNDTVYHKIDDFHFTNQTGKVVSLQDFSGALIVADFFFTNCEGICPKMTKQMKRLYERYKDNDSVRFLSHTVDPESDSVPKLAEYARLQGAELPSWNFVTGDKKELYDQARNSYMVVNTKGDGGPDDFIHTQNFALIDRKRSIRGYYDGTDSLEMQRLERDIELLLQQKE